MSGTYPYEMPKAFVGMKADSMEDNVDTLPCGATAIPIGNVCGKSAAGKAVIPVGSLQAGVALHDQVIDFVGGGKYVEYMAVSVMTKGRVWGRASGTCTKDAVAKYDPATGLFADTGTATLANARFKSANQVSVGIFPTDATQNMVLVELHDPSV